MFGSKPTTGLFGGTGTANTSFGSTSFGAPSTPFGGGNVGFGSSTFGTPAQTGGGMFGQQSTSTAGLFGGASSFGATNTASTPFGGFGAGVQTSNTSSSGLFGGTTSTAFGTPSLFGQPAQQAQPATGFGQAAGLNMFGLGSQQTGTTVKFVATPGTDIMMKSGISTNVSTKLQCITAMKEYENKSLEELRLEDYNANRKSGLVMNVGFGSTAASGGGFMGASSQQQQQQTSSFGLFGNQNKPTFSGFGTPSAANNTSLFGASQQAKPLFGAPATVTSASNAFGGLAGGNLFGNASKPGGLFGAAAATTTTQSLGFFGNSQPAGNTGFGLTNQNNMGGLFGGNKIGFGQPTTTTAPGFGFAAPQLNQSTLGGPFGTGNLFNKPATTTVSGFGVNAQAPTLFGGFNNPTSNATQFGSLGASTGTSLFGQQKPAGSLFGNNTGFASNTNALGGTGAGTNSLLGGGSLGGTFGSSSFNIFGSQSQQQPLNADAALIQQKQQIQQHIQALNTSPYGDSPLFKNLKKDDMLRPTNAEAQKAVIISQLSNSTPGLILSGGGNHRLAIKTKPLQMQTFSGGKYNLFDELDQDENSQAASTLAPSASAAATAERFVPRRNFKQLNIKAIMEQQQASNTSKEAASSKCSTQNSSSVVFELNTSTGKPVNVSSEKVDSEGVNNTMAELLSKNRNVLEVSDNNDDKHSNSTDHSENYQVKENRLPHPAGVVLTRPDYFTLPTLDEMVEVIDQDGRCIVDDFVIGREGYGNIFFPGKIDVTNLNLDEIVFFRRKEVEVYPVESSKPPVGEGLNRTAQVTLDRVFPVDKTTGELITDYTRLVAMGYMDKLERNAVKMNAKFVEYRPTTGSFVFIVNHFSKYTVADDDSDDDAVLAKQLPKDPNTLQQPQQLQTLMSTATTTTVQSADYFKQQQNKPIFTTNQQTQQLFLRDLDEVEMEKAEESDDIENDMMDYEKKDEAKLLRPKAKRLYDDNDDIEESSDKKNKQTDDVDEEDDTDFYGYNKENTFPSYQMLRNISAHSIQLQKASFFWDNDNLGDDEEEGDVRKIKMAAAKMKDVIGGTADSKSLSKPAQLLKEFVSSREKDDDNFGSESMMKINTSGKQNQKLQPLPSPAPQMPYRSPHPIICCMELPDDSDKKLVEIFRKNRQNLVSKVSLKSCFPGAVDRTLTDISLYQRGATRVGWQKGRWSFCHSSLPVTSLEENDNEVSLSAKLMHERTRQTEANIKTHNLPTILHEQIIVPGSKDQNVDRMAILEQCLSTELNHCKVLRSDDDILHERSHIHDHSADIHMEDDEDNSDGQPRKTLTDPSLIDCPFVSFAHDAQSLMNELVDRLKSSEAQSHWTKVMLSALELCLVLWGSLNGPHRNYNDDDDDDADVGSQDYYYTQKRRKDRLSAWLSKEVQQKIEEEVQQIYSKKSRSEDDDGQVTYLYMTGRLMEEAIQSALEVKDYRLAMLISQAIGNDDVRLELKKQLIGWCTTEMDRFISKPRLSICTLLSGSLVQKTSQEVINCCHQLDWKRCFAMHLWYACPATCLISEALERYDASYRGEEMHGAISVAPLPQYLENLGVLQNEDGAPCDVTYHLLKLYCLEDHPLYKLLSPRTFIDDEMDYSGSWHMMKVLESLRFGNLSTHHHMYICHSYASQLESLGLWWWSVFVLMHITHPLIRKNSVKKVIERNVEIMKQRDDEDGEHDDEDDVLLNDKEMFVVDKLKIPAEWLHEAKAIKCQWLNMPHLEAKHSFLARRYNRYHDIIIGRSVASRIIINDDLRSYLYWLNRLRDGGPCGSLFKEREVATYLNYMQLLQAVNKMEVVRLDEGGLEDKEILEMRMTLYSDQMAEQLKNFKCNNSTDRLAYMKMFRVLAKAVNLRSVKTDHDLSVCLIKWKFPLSYDALHCGSLDDVTTHATQSNSDGLCSSYNSHLQSGDILSALLKA
ncbi:hypothetical protein HELRODRAFT_191188 [Helobdella robusta]|uniref:Nuclear pore complex protein Nup98-Nup96 n=1 Tax=Helobdella robusta TaxID=6412 RepID=T1FSQ4_HELRO|nr:hypothetical protein HELRODRAFT_191188 [Helobdella robusta]ESO06765.1 hypothetical protein HELRODRAFT_191188 [Helobdella robusta]